MTPSEVARALRALSSTYVERRSRLSGRGAFDTAGKRAAYALYYAPRRFLMVTHVLREIAPAARPSTLLDLGCGTGAAGVAWAQVVGPGAAMHGVDAHPWALEETRAAYRIFGVPGQARRAAVDRGVVDAATRELARTRTGSGLGILASYVLNELDDDVRRAMLPSMLAAAGAGAHVLVFEPLSRRTSPWWTTWAEAFVAAGGRADQWRLRVTPPPVTRALGTAAGLDPLEATGRTLWI